MKISHLILTVLSAAIICSCAIVKHEDLASTNSVQNENKEYVDNVTTYSSTLYFWGLGIRKSYSETINAKNKLFANYKLNEGERFENFLVTERKVIYPFGFTKLEVILNADVVKYENNKIVNYNENYRKRLSSFNVDSASYFNFNQKVITTKRFSYGYIIKLSRVIDIQKNHIVAIDENFNINRINKKKVFTTEDSEVIKINNQYTVSKLGEKLSGPVVGVNKESILMRIDQSDGTEIYEIFSLEKVDK